MNDGWLFVFFMGVVWNSIFTPLKILFLCVKGGDFKKIIINFALVSKGFRRKQAKGD